MITKDNVITYAYKGFAALILSIIGKKGKVKELYVEEEVFNENIKLAASRLDKASEAIKNLEKILKEFDVE